jgi:sensor histidine kinase YesM
MKNLLRLLLSVNLTAFAVLLFIQLSSDRPLRAMFVGTPLLYVLLYTNAAGIPAILFLPRIVHWAARKKYPLPFAIGLGSAVFTAIGCFIAARIIVGLGRARAETFWNEYFTLLRFCALFAVVISVAIYLYQSMRHQLQRQTERLNEQSLATERAEKLAIQARLATLESRLQPHFLFNTLNSISALIPLDPQRAEQMVERLAQLLRSSLDNSCCSLVPLRQELQFVRDYLDIEKERLDSKLETEIDIPPNLQDAPIPPFALQLLVENAVKHGIAPQRNGGTLAVSARANEQHLSVEVRDDGQGFDLTAVPAGHGLDNLVSRLAVLFGDEAHLNVSSCDGWCIVEMVIPFSKREPNNAARLSG